MKHSQRARGFHDELKRDAELWARLVVPIGEQADADGGVLELGNCRVCCSTLARRKGG